MPKPRMIAEIAATRALFREGRWGEHDIRRRFCMIHGKEL